MENNQPPDREQVKKLVQYLAILFPDGKAIDPVRPPGTGGQLYKDEVIQFYELIGNEWTHRYCSIIRGGELCYKPENIRTGSWVDIRAVFTFCSRQDRNSCRSYSVFHLQAEGIRQALLRAKELAQI